MSGLPSSLSSLLTLLQAIFFSSFSPFLSEVVLVIAQLSSSSRTVSGVDDTFHDGIRLTIPLPSLLPSFSFRVVKTSFNNGVPSSSSSLSSPTTDINGDTKDDGLINVFVVVFVFVSSILFSDVRCCCCFCRVRIEDTSVISSFSSSSLFTTMLINDLVVIVFDILFVVSIIRVLFAPLLMVVS